MSEMIERVARAIAQADEQNGGPPYEHRIGLGKHAKGQLFDQARAAVEAMREPTVQMRAAVDKAEIDGGCIAAAYEHIEWDDAWTVAIDAALSESPSPQEN